jgi:hypothetical protein
VPCLLLQVKFKSHTNYEYGRENYIMLGDLQGAVDLHAMLQELERAIEHDPAEERVEQPRANGVDIDCQCTVVMVVVLPCDHEVDAAADACILERVALVPADGALRWRFHGLA